MPRPSFHYYTSRIVMLARSGMIHNARLLFDRMPQRDLVSCNAMLSAYSQNGYHGEALSFFMDMRVAGLRCDPYTFTAAVSACANAGELNHGKKLHGLIISLGFDSCLPVCNSLIDMYGKLLHPFCSLTLFGHMKELNYVSWCSLLSSYMQSGLLEHANSVFNKMPERTIVAWNTMIAGYACHGDVSSCFNLFKEMRRAGKSPELPTFLSLMSVCCDVGHGSHGLMCHSCIAKSGLDTVVEVINSLLKFYAKLDRLEEATKIFKCLDHRTQVSWNVMIDAYMRHENVDEAFTLFQLAPERNIISWTTMIVGCTRNGYSELSLDLFVKMRANQLQPDDFTFVAVLHACASLALLGCGKILHACIVRMGFCSSIYVTNGLINMYAKCGDLLEAHKMFDATKNKDKVSWNAMICGLGQHGKAEEVLRLFKAMVKSNVRPDKVTFIGMLIAFRHSGLFEQAWLHFESMVHNYGITPDADHIACMIDILGRAGFLKEACSLVKDSYNTEIDVSGSLLGSCLLHGDIDLARRIAGNLLLLEPKEEVGYIMLSNLYCGLGQWLEAQGVRKNMVKQGVRKIPGCSWIEVKNNVVAFAAGDSSHPKINVIRKILHSLASQMRSTNCNPLVSKRNLNSKQKL
ncbi:unnamed protein product [Victoria cruziana]